jgi:hypothetical protein
VGELTEYARRCKAIDLLHRGSRFAAPAALAAAGSQISPWQCRKLVNDVMAHGAT